ncbi:hypothetical protein GL297_04110 [Komagataeibacter sp. FXV2]|nr:hypothetical protein [Komagataeibacter sp. FXV2]
MITARLARADFPADMSRQGAILHCASCRSGYPIEKHGNLVCLHNFASHGVPDAKISIPHIPKIITKT